MKLLLVVTISVALLLFTACSKKKSPQEPKKNKKISKIISAQEIDNSVPGSYSIKQSTQLDKYYGKITIEYQDYGVLLKNTKDYLNMRVSSKKIIDERLSQLPKGGILKVRVFRGSIDSVDLSRFIFVIKHKDKELQRQAGLKSKVNIPNSAGYWWSEQVINMESIIVDEISFYVIDTLSQSIDTFEIKRNK